MLFLADVILYGGMVILAILLLFLIMLIVCPLLFDFWERKYPEKKSQSANGTCTSHTDVPSFTADTSDYRRKRQRLQQQMQWQQETANRVAQEAMQRAQSDAHNAMVTAEQAHITALDMHHSGNSMHEEAHSMATASAHDSFNDTFSAPSFDCGSFGNPFF